MSYTDVVECLIEPPGCRRRIHLSLSQNLHRFVDIANDSLNELVGQHPVCRVSLGKIHESNHRTKNVQRQVDHHHRFARRCGSGTPTQPLQFLSL